jgi:ABC-type antimicrobial peptide transport system permease subunit
LAVLILRTALERRGQFALLMSTGLSRGSLARLLLLEHGGLLLAGLVLGTLAALVAVAPQLASATAAVNWPVLVAVILCILATGLGTCAAAARTVARGRLVEELRSE